MSRECSQNVLSDARMRPSSLTVNLRLAISKVHVRPRMVFQNLFAGSSSTFTKDQFIKYNTLNCTYPRETNSPGVRRSERPHDSHPPIRRYRGLSISALGFIKNRILCIYRCYQDVHLRASSNRAFWVISILGWKHNGTFSYVDTSCEVYKCGVNSGCEQLENVRKYEKEDSGTKTGRRPKVQRRRRQLETRLAARWARRPRRNASPRNRTTLPGKWDFPGTARRAYTKRRASRQRGAGIVRRHDRPLGVKGAVQRPRLTQSGCPRQKLNEE